MLITQELSLVYKLRNFCCDLYSKLTLLSGRILLVFRFLNSFFLLSTRKRLSTRAEAYRKFMKKLAAKDTMKHEVTEKPPTKAIRSQTVND